MMGITGSKGSFQGYTGMQGMTGIGGRIYDCCVCTHGGPLEFIDDNFAWVDAVWRHSAPSPHLNKIIPICMNCLDVTKPLILSMREMDIKDMPLYVSDSNILIKSFAAKRLQVWLPGATDVKM